MNCRWCGKIIKKTESKRELGMYNYDHENCHKERMGKSYKPLTTLDSFAVQTNDEKVI